MHNYFSGWTFGICVGTDLKYLERAILSIISQKIPNFEIFVICDYPIEIDNSIVKIILVESKLKNWITGKKNIIIKSAKYNNICIMHDYLYLDNKWYLGFLKYGNEWNVLSNKILNPFRNNQRVADWMTLDHPLYGIFLLPYSRNNCSKYMYLTGLYFCVKKDFIINNNLYLNESLVWGDSEDQEWSIRVRKLTSFSFNPYSIIYTSKDKYFPFLYELNFLIKLKKIIRIILNYFTKKR